MVGCQNRGTRLGPVHPFLTAASISKLSQKCLQDIAVDSYGVTFTFLDLEDLDAVAAAISPKTRLLWVEAASNPLGHPGNLPGLVRLCRTAETPHMGWKAFSAFSGTCFYCQFPYVCFWCRF